MALSFDPPPSRDRARPRTELLTVDMESSVLSSPPYYLAILPAHRMSEKTRRTRATILTCRMDMNTNTLTHTPLLALKVRVWSQECKSTRQVVLRADSYNLTPTS